MRGGSSISPYRKNTRSVFPAYAGVILKNNQKNNRMSIKLRKSGGSSGKNNLKSNYKIIIEGGKAVNFEWDDAFFLSCIACAKRR